MNKYQMLYIIDIDVADEAKAEVVDKFSALVESLGGEVESVEKWGVRKFAYPINFKKEGYYVLMKFSAKPEDPQEIERQMKNTDSIVRQMITRI